MSKKNDFVENGKVIKINESKEKSESIIEELKKLGNTDAPSISELSDDALNILVSNLTLQDSEGRTIVFMNEDEAIIYSAQLQRNIPQIRFCKIIPCYSILGGKFYIIEPVSTEQAKNMTEEELLKPTDLSYVSEIILMAIVEKAKREAKLVEEK